MLEINNLTYLIAILMSIVALYCVYNYNKDKKEEDGLKIENPSSGMKKVISELHEISNRLNMIENKMSIINDSISHKHIQVRNTINDINDREHFRQAYILNSLPATS